MTILELDVRAVYADLVIGSDTLWPEDRARLFALVDLDPGFDVVAFAEAVRAYYGDADRADRTPRSLLYFHIGLLCGAIARDHAGPGGVA